MSDDWKVGDLAVCVSSVAGSVLVEGRVYTVTGVDVAESWYADAGEVGLHLREARANNRCGGFYAYRFRKIRPDEHEACEEEFRILLQLSKKRVQA
jgi:hypothetical protein